jgi:hypothetical protein
VDLFSYILILTSVIYALAVAQILDGVSRLAQYQHPVRTFIPHTIWVINLFVFIFLVWWASWEFREIEWTFPMYAYMLIAPTLLFLACSLLIPQRLLNEGVDLESHFFRIRRLFFGAYLFGALAVIIDGNVLSDEAIWHSGRISHIVIIGAAIMGYFSTSKRVHLVLAVMTLVAYFGLFLTRFFFPA